MHAHVPVHTRAVKADVHAKGDTRPCRIASLTIKAHLGMMRTGMAANRPSTHLVSLLCLQDLEYLVCLCLRRVCHRRIGTFNERNDWSSWCQAMTPSPCGVMGRRRAVGGLKTLCSKSKHYVCLPKALLKRRKTTWIRRPAVVCSLSLTSTNSPLLSADGHNLWRVPHLCHSPAFSESSLLGAVDVRAISADKTISLRHSVLWPNHPISHVKLPEDELGFHYGAFLPTGDHPVAIISVFKEPVNAGDVAAARFRKFACEPAFQGRGIGSRLLEHVFAVARLELGCSVVWCDARLATAEWYKKRKMVPFGQTFFKEDIEYVRMMWTAKP